MKQYTWMKLLVVSALATAFTLPLAQPVSAMTDRVGNPHEVAVKYANTLPVIEDVKMSVERINPFWGENLHKHEHFLEVKGKKAWTVADNFVYEVASRGQFYAERHDWMPNSEGSILVQELSRKLELGFPRATKEKRQVQFVMETLQAVSAKTDNGELKNYLQNMIHYGATQTAYALYCENTPHHKTHKKEVVAPKSHKVDLRKAIHGEKEATVENTPIRKDATIAIDDKNHKAMVVDKPKSKKERISDIFKVVLDRRPF